MARIPAESKARLAEIEKRFPHHGKNGSLYATQPQAFSDIVWLRDELSAAWVLIELLEVELED